MGADVSEEARVIAKLSKNKVGMCVIYARRCCCIWQKRLRSLSLFTAGANRCTGGSTARGLRMKRVLRFFRYAVSLGADPANWNCSQFARMPDGLRDNGRRQTVYFFNPRVVK